MTIDHAALRAAAEKATPGKWIETAPTETLHAVRSSNGRIVADVGYSGSLDKDRQNAAYIAAANPAVVKALLDEIADKDAKLKKSEEQQQFNANAWMKARDEISALKNQISVSKESLPAVDSGIVHTGAPIPDWPESVSLADLDYARDVPDGMDQDIRSLWQQLQVAHRNMTNMRGYARQLRHLLSGGSLAAPKGDSNG